MKDVLLFFLVLVVIGVIAFPLSLFLMLWSWQILQSLTHANLGDQVAGGLAMALVFLLVGVVLTVVMEEV